MIKDIEYIEINILISLNYHLNLLQTTLGHIHSLQTVQMIFVCLFANFY